jgi:hypothetical protein
VSDPQFIKNATGQPVWVETKQDYWNLLNRTGWIMADQQESTTGPVQERPAPKIPLEFTPTPAPDPIT